MTSGQPLLPIHVTRCEVGLMTILLRGREVCPCVGNMATNWNRRKSFCSMVVLQKPLPQIIVGCVGSRWMTYGMRLAQYP